MTFPLAELTQQISNNRQSPAWPDQPVPEWMYTYRIFKVFLPVRLSGLEMPLPAALQLFTDIATIDPELGWLVQIGAGAGYFAGFMQESALAPYALQPDFVIAGSGTASGRAVLQEHHYIVNGSWKYCSGSRYATLFTVICEMENGTTKGVALLPEQLQVQADWPAYGMKHTSSDSVTACDAVVPPALFFDSGILLNDYNYPLYHFPFIPFARLCLYSVTAGSFYHFAALAGQVMRDMANRQPERAALLAEALSAAQEKAVHTQEKVTLIAQKSWEEIKAGPLPPAAITHIENVVTSASRLIFDLSCDLFYNTGMQMVAENTALNLAWKNLTTICQHHLLKS